MIKMPGLERLNPAVTGLVALNGVLAIVALAIALWPVSKEAVSSGPAAASTTAAQTVRASFPAPQSPLFARSIIAPAAPTPKPMSPTANGAQVLAVQEARPLQWRVTGIIIAEGVAPIALIERKGEIAEVRRVLVGATVEDWLIEHIAMRAVSFRRGTVLVSVPLDPIGGVNYTQPPLP